MTLKQMKSGCGAGGSALPWGGRGRKFKSCHSDQKSTMVLNKSHRAFFLAIKGECRQPESAGKVRYAWHDFSERQASSERGWKAAENCFCFRWKKSRGSGKNVSEIRSEAITKNIRYRKPMSTLVRHAERFSMLRWEITRQNKRRLIWAHSADQSASK